MMLISSTWNTGKTFRLISASQECPYNEAIYDPEQKVLAVISKECKETFQMVPRFNDKGDVQYLKSQRDNGKTYAEERRALDTWVEYYLEDEVDISYLINLFAINADSFDYQKYYESQSKIVNPTIFEGPIVM